MCVCVCVFCKKTPASQVALVVKNLPANEGEIRNPGLIPGLEGLLNEGMETHSRTLVQRIPMDRRAWQAAVCRVSQSDMTEVT